MRPPDDTDHRDPSGDEVSASSDVLVGQLYDELREMAHRQMSRERRGQTLQTTALVHEVFMRLGPGWPGAIATDGQQRFFQAAAIAMRRILVERARARGRLKRGGGRRRVELEAVEGPVCEAEVDWLALHDALTVLEAHDQDLANLVGLRYFAGLSVDQTATVLGVSPRTVDRDWRIARAFLQRHLMDSGGYTAP